MTQWLGASSPHVRTGGNAEPPPVPITRDAHWRGRAVPERNGFWTETRRCLCGGRGQARRPPVGCAPSFPAAGISPKIKLPEETRPWNFSRASYTRHEPSSLRYPRPHARVHLRAHAYYVPSKINANKRPRSGQTWKIDKRRETGLEMEKPTVILPGPAPCRPARPAFTRAS